MFTFLQMLMRKEVLIGAIVLAATAYVLYEYNTLLSEIDDKTIQIIQLEKEIYRLKEQHTALQLSYAEASIKHKIEIDKITEEVEQNMTTVSIAIASRTKEYVDTLTNVDGNTSQNIQYSNQVISTIYAAYNYAKDK